MAHIHLNSTDEHLVAQTAKRLGREINEARHARGVSVNKLEWATGTHHRTIYDLECGRQTHVNLATLVKLADRLGLEVVLAPRKAPT